MDLELACTWTHFNHLQEENGKVQKQWIPEELNSKTVDIQAHIQMNLSGLSYESEGFEEGDQSWRNGVCNSEQMKLNLQMNQCDICTLSPLSKIGKMMMEWCMGAHRPME